MLLHLKHGRKVFSTMLDICLKAIQEEERKALEIFHQAEKELLLVLNGKPENITKTLCSIKFKLT